MNPLKEIVGDVLRFVNDRELLVEFWMGGLSAERYHLKAHLEKKKELYLKPQPPPNRDTTEGKVPIDDSEDGWFG